MKRIMENAEKEAFLSIHKVLYPAHLLFASLNEKSGVLGEIVLKTDLDKTSLRNKINVIEKDFFHRTVESEFFNIGVTDDVVKVFTTAIDYMNKYNQIYVNEGHLLKALITTEAIGNLISDEDKNLILTLGTTSRDMITYLGTYTFPNIHTPFIRRVNNRDRDKLIEFVEKNFPGWSQTIREGFLLSEPSIYIAFDNDGNIIGFAAFDVYKNKKCYFGPMGVSKSNRVKGIGYALLHHCLRDMSEIGYEYAIIGGAGPIEFYEKACNAVVVPLINS
jgi:N-acetylglutamate synthase-like GNAT family acetyltransferase